MCRPIWALQLRLTESGTGRMALQSRFEWFVPSGIDATGPNDGFPRGARRRILSKQPGLGQYPACFAWATRRRTNSPGFPGCHTTNTPLRLDLRLPSGGWGLRTYAAGIACAGVSRNNHCRLSRRSVRLKNRVRNSLLARHQVGEAISPMASNGGMNNEPRNLA